MTHMMTVEALDLKIVEKVFTPSRHEMTYTGKFVINTRRKLLKEYIEEVPLSVISTEALDYMHQEIDNLHDEIYELRAELIARDDEIINLKSTIAAKEVSE